MSDKIIQNFDDLKKRVKRFFDAPELGRGVVREFVDKLSQHGELVIFGGMLRDLSLTGGIAEFKSDVDLVIQLYDESLPLESMLISYNYEKNKFGGFRINLGKWKLDLWRLEDTWAFKEKHLLCQGFPGLVRTTFFNWDAIIYFFNTGEVHSATGYIEALRSKMLDINFEPNPNPIGNILKAFRYYEQFGANFSPRLTEYMYEHLKPVLGGTETMTGIALRYQRMLQDSTSVIDLFHSIEQHQKHASHTPFQFRRRQQTIW